MKRLYPSFFALVALGMAPAHADSVSGSFVMGETEVAPTEVSAFRIRDQSNPKQFQTLVLLTRQAPDREAIRDALDPYTVAINDEATSGQDYLTLFVKDGEDVSLNATIEGVQYLDTTGRIMGQRGSLTAECSTRTTERVACTVKTSKPVETRSGASWTLNVTFDVAVLKRAAGKPLAKGGEEPGKALAALGKALGGSDLATITALLTEDEAASYDNDYNTPEENLEEVKDMFSRRIPLNPTVNGGEYLPDGRALLEVEGSLKDWGDGKTLHYVVMSQRDGRWVFERADLIGMLVGD